MITANVGAFRADLIGRYLRPHRKAVLLGALALVIVNVLSVSIPLLVRQVIDDLQDGFALRDLLHDRGGQRVEQQIVRPLAHARLQVDDQPKL